MPVNHLRLVRDRARKNPLYGFIPFDELDVGDSVIVQCHRNSVYNFNRNHPETMFSTAGTAALPEGCTKITRVR